MRWGVRDDAADDHITTALCMEEIENCKRTSVGLNFVVSWFRTVLLQSLGRLLLENQHMVHHHVTHPRLVQALLCQRYGHRPIPASIDAGEFELLLAQLTKVDKQRELLDTWFRKDTNAIPPVYILQKISSIIPQYLSQVPVSYHSTSHMYQ